MCVTRKMQASRSSKATLTETMRAFGDMQPYLRHCDPRVMSNPMSRREPVVVSKP